MRGIQEVDMTVGLVYEEKRMENDARSRILGTYAIKTWKKRLRIRI